MKESDLTPAQAWHFMSKAARDPDILAKGLHIQGGEKSIALLCHAAEAMSIRVLGASCNGKEIKLNRRIKKMRKAEWYSYQVQQLRLLPDISETKQSATLEDYGIAALAELNGLTGLAEVKGQVGDMAAFLKVMKSRQKQGLKVTTMGQHLVFTGNPGTGKTTVARLVGQIYRDLGSLRSGHFIEVGGRDLIAEYVGQTAPKVDAVVEKALDGILFIDEAYALAAEDSRCDFGPEAVATLIRHMENYRERLVVIIAGYDYEMERLLHSNPGMKSRFKTKIAFPDYAPIELVAIFSHICNDQGYVLAPEAQRTVVRLCTDLHRTKNKNFGNGRTVRNIFDKAVMKQARRLSVTNRKPSKSALQTLHAVDIPGVQEIEW
ncbi:MAG: AAA family ATPase [Lewinella sp.]|nr:AAA family ATPase [Lewinella sp.]